MSHCQGLNDAVARGLLALCLLVMGACNYDESLTSRFAREVSDFATPKSATESAAAEEAVAETADPIAVAPPAPRAETPPKTADAVQIPASKESVYYHYIDASGSLRFVRERSDIPKSARKNARRVAVKNEPISSPPSAARAAREPRAEPRRPWQDAYEAPWQGRARQVVVYSAPWCGWCRKTTAYLKSQGVRYVEKDIEANPAYHRELVDKTGRTSIPVIDVDGQLIRGYNRAEIDRLLNL